MHCHDVFSRLEPYLDNALPDLESEQLRRHLADCSACQSALQKEATWRELLATLPVPAPSAGFADRVLANAKADSPHSPRRWSSSVVGTAMAACLVLGMGLGFWLPQTDENTGGLVQQQQETEALKTVRLVFSAGRELENVNLTLELPPGVELEAFPGLHSVSWNVNLKAGQNVLALPLRVLFEGEGELVARLDTGGKQKVFRAVIQDALQRDSAGARPS